MSDIEYYYEATVGSVEQPTETQMEKMASVLKGAITYNAPQGWLTFVFRRSFPDPSHADPVVRGRFAVLEALEVMPHAGVVLRQQLRDFRVIRVADTPTEYAVPQSA